jgi:hypothetical protein
VVLRATVAGDGLVRQMAMIDRRTLTMWLVYYVAEKCEGSAQVCETNPQFTALSARSSGCLDALPESYLIP